MPIEVNSTTQKWVEGENINGLLKRMNYIYPMLVIKINGEVVPKSQYASRLIPDNSVVEVIHLESGG